MSAPMTTIRISRFDWAGTDSQRTPMRKLSGIRSRDNEDCSEFSPPKKVMLSIPPISDTSSVHFDNGGPNCWPAVLYAVGLERSLEYMRRLVYVSCCTMGVSEHLIAIG